MKVIQAFHFTEQLNSVTLFKVCSITSLTCFCVFVTICLICGLYTILWASPNFREINSLVQGIFGASALSILPLVSSLGIIQICFRKAKKKKETKKVKRAADLEESVNPQASLQKILKDFGSIEEHKPTLLFSQETADEIEKSLIAYFQSTTSFTLSKDSYKVKFYL